MIVTTDKGAPGDYVSIFDWSSGDSILLLTPSATGEWLYEPSFDVNCGITYVHKYAVPQTHGPYAIAGKYGPTISSGYIFITYASSGGSYVVTYDKTATTNVNWVSNFEQTLNIGLLEYVYSSGVVTMPLQKKVINMFSLDWNLYIYGGNGTWYNDTHTWILELMDKNDIVLAVLKSEGDGTFRSGLWYGTSLTTLTKAPQTAQYPYTSGRVTFTSGSIIYEANDNNVNNRSFTMSVNISQVSKMRVSGSAYSTYTGGGGAGGYIKIIPPKTV